MRPVLWARALLLAGLAGALFGRGLEAQQAGTPAAPPEQSGRDDPLRFRIGPFQISPYIRVGQVAVDTNVNYTPEDRKTDFTTNGGPGLRITLPIGRVRLYGDGNVSYYWFARTKEERRFGGEAGSGLDWETSRHALGVSRFFSRNYQRPSIEVDRRVEQDRWSDDAHLDLDLGRIGLLPAYYGEKSDVAKGTQYLGTDLAKTLTQEARTAVLELDWHLTPKTDFVVFGDQEWRRFSEDETRDSDSNRIAGGFQIRSETRLSGRAAGGVRLFRPSDPRRGHSFRRPYAEAALDWILGAKTRLGAGYRYDTQYSAFDSTSARLPVVVTQDARLRLNRRLGRRFDIDLEGGVTTLENDAPVVIRDADGLREIARNDVFYSARADLGFTFWRLRLGIVGTYNERQSNFADFGVDGLLAGASIRFNPGGVGSGGRQGGRRAGAGRSGR
jgi:hypothetical protein